MSFFEYDRKRAMKQKDFTKCLCCGKGMMHAGGLFFYRVTIERLGVDVPAVRRQMGMEQMLGGSAAAGVIAQVMGPDDDIGLPVGDAARGLVCDECAIRSQSCLGQLAETMGDRKEATEARERTEETGT